MTIKPAIVKRILELCEEKGIAPNELATRSGVTPSTVYSLFKENRKDMSIITLKKLSDGLDISLKEFFTSDIFSLLEQEIK